MSCQLHRPIVSCLSPLSVRPHSQENSSMDWGKFGGRVTYKAHQDPAPAAPHRHLIAAPPKQHDKWHHNQATSPFLQFMRRQSPGRCRQRDPPKVDKKPPYNVSSSSFVPIPPRVTTKKKAATQPTHPENKKRRVVFTYLCDSSDDEK